MSKAADIDVSLTSINVPVTEEDNWTYIPANILDQSVDFEEWLDKNGVRYIITNEYLEESMINPKQDEFLNQLNNDSSPSLDQLSDYETYQVTDFNDPKSIDVEELSMIYSRVVSNSPGVTDRNMNTVPRESNKSSKENVKFNSKCIALEKESNSDIYIELVQEQDRLKLLVRDTQGNEVVPFHCLPPSEVGGQIKHPFIRQSISLVSRISLSTEIDLHMAKLQTEQGLKLFLCPQQDCRQAFMRLATAKHHSLMHVGHKPFKCSFDNCTWAFYTPFKLKRHEDTHFKRKDFVCPVPECAKRFTTIYNLNGHRRMHERPADLPCPVQKCKEMFQTTRARQIHLKNHRRSEGSFQCPDCGKKFFTQSTLQAHTRSHSHKDSELQCKWPNCGKVFEQPYRLKEHERMHTGQKPYCCSFENCKWSFPTASKLKRHQSTHINERKFHCTIGSCNKSFLRSEHLREHTLTHIGQRTYICEGKQSILYRDLATREFSGLLLCHN